MGFFDWLSLGLDFCPGIGEVKAILELIAGKDLITHEDLNAFDRASCVISVVPVASWIVKLKKSQKAIKHAAKFTRFFKVVEAFNKANDAVDRFNLIMLLLDESGCNTSDKKLDNSLLVLALFPVKEGKYIVHSSVNYKYVWDVDINSSNLQVWERHGGLNQQFIFNPNFVVFLISNRGHWRNKNWIYTISSANISERIHISSVKIFSYRCLNYCDIF